jgi:hypothetical protein
VEFCDQLHPLAAWELQIPTGYEGGGSGRCSSRDSSPSLQDIDMDVHSGLRGLYMSYRFMPENAYNIEGT